VTASVATGDAGNALITVRIPVDRVEDAVTQLSALGRIVSQQVSIQDLQADLDRMERRQDSLREQIARISARLESGTLDAETEAVLEARRRALRTELRQLRQGIASTSAEARMATIQLTVVSEEGAGVAPPASRLDRTLDEAVNILVWEAVVVLAILIVAAPFAIAFGIAWAGRRLYRRREEDRLLAT
jgi:cell division protein FtsB